MCNKAELSAAMQRERSEAQSLEDGFHLPINQRIEDSVDMDGLQAASTAEAIPETNRGFQMLQRMGWKGQGLGSKEDGAKRNSLSQHLSRTNSTLKL